MARCSREACRRWRPDLVVKYVRIGLHVDDAWFCSNLCVEAEAERRLREAQARENAPPPPALRLGSLLLQQRGVTSSQLIAGLAAQHQSGLRLGDQLMQLGYTSRDQLLRALAAQSGVRYLTTIDPVSVRTAPGGLSPDEVRALGVVPFREDEGRLLVACAAPLRHAALDALTILTGRIVEPFLVADDDVARLQAAYGESVSASIETTTVRDIADGASRVAAAAAGAGTVSVKEAHVDSFTWVRIAANGRISTLLVPPATRQEEPDLWLAATTRH
jgi:Type II secretion system (T2SS), protein E, N-terminal domain